MQTHEWEALLDGTTPGPWEWHGDQDPDMRYIYSDEGGMCMTVEPVGSDYRDADPVLAAHAPAAVAEVVRLRWEIAAMRDRYLARIAAADCITADLMEDQYMVDALARILEGDTDE